MGQVKTILILFTSVVLAGVPAAPTGRERIPAFHGRATPIAAAMRTRMTGVSWHRGCPVGFAGLRLLRLSHWGFDGAIHRGRLVVNRDEATAMLRTMRLL